jgi:uncharacterized protein YigE (DUF2233 family)
MFCDLKMPAYRQMPTLKYFIIAFCFLLESLVVAGCEPNHLPATPSLILTPTLAPTPTLTQTPFFALETTLTPQHSPDTGWYVLRPGLERRIISIIDDKNQWVESLYVLRLNTNRYRFDVAYHPTPMTLQDWQAETNALIVVNGGYFRKNNDEYIPDGLTIANGEVIGSSYGNFAGMLAITNDGPELRWLAQRPYDPNESLLAALQSFPILVKPGGELGFPQQYEDHQQARRTIIGQDRDGRILLIVTPQGYFTLHQLSVYLTESDLDLDIAINLDGGPSSGILVANQPYEISAQTLLPVVITVYIR